MFDFRDYIDLEEMLTQRLVGTWGSISRQVYRQVATALKNNDFGLAIDIANDLDLTPIGEENQGFMQTVFSGCVEHGASVAANGVPRMPARAFSPEIKNVVTQVMLTMEHSATLQMRKRLLQLIAGTKAKYEQDTIQKADPIRDFVSFDLDGSRYMQMISALHTSRLSGWGFVAESQMLSQTTYRLSAMLDKRTSKFCRLIDGKVFTVESAAPVLEAAVYTDDPEALKAIQPWPDQSKLSMERISKMSTDELVSHRMHVPPFHPNCRTMMVRVSQRFKPADVKERPAELPEHLSTLDDFTSLGIKLPEADLGVWNDYVKINPAQSLSTLYGLNFKELAGKVLGRKAISIDAKSVIRWSYNGVRVNYDPLLAQVELQSGESLLDFVEGSMALSMALGAQSIVTNLSGLEAVEMLLKGFAPTAVDWQAVRLKLADTLESKLEGVLAERVGQLLGSTNPKGLLALYGMAEDNQSIRQALSRLKFRASLAMNSIELTPGE